MTRVGREATAVDEAPVEAAVLTASHAWL